MQILSHPSFHGLWRNNPGLVQLLGLCPLLAVTSTVINGIGLGLATLLTLLGSNVLVSLCRKIIQPEIRIPAYVLIIATLVTLVELSMQAWFFDLYKVLGIFIPLIVTNCTIIARAEAYASKNPVHLAAIDGIVTGMGFFAVLVVLGAMRELLGQGRLFSNAQLLFGPNAQNWTLQFSENPDGLLLMVLPPGAFLALGLLVALKNVINNRRAITKAPRIEIGKPAI